MLSRHKFRYDFGSRTKKHREFSIQGTIKNLDIVRFLIQAFLNKGQYAAKSFDRRKNHESKQTHSAYDNRRKNLAINSI